MDFVKKNLLSIIALVIGLAGLIGGWIISSGMTKKQIDDVRQDAVQAANSINSLQVDYELPALRPGEEPWTMSRVTPNSRLTQIVGEQLEALVAQSEEVRQEAIAHNSAGKTVLVEGLFPKPQNEEAERISLSARMVERWPEAHEELLERSNAGGPIDAQQMASRLTTQRQQMVEQILGSRANQELSPFEEQEITNDLAKARLGMLKGHADSLTVFGERDLFVKLNEIPADGLVTRERYQTLFWDWQHAYWVHEDILEAVVTANEGSDGISGAPIKRIFSITLEPAYNSEVTQGSLSQPISEDYSQSFTGRVGGNPLFDIRYATVDAIIDLSRLPEIENAISEANFMTLIDLDYYEINPDQDLREGYYYGDQSLVRAQMRIETVWLRSWIEQYLPPRVREIMGLPVETESPDDGSDGQF